MTWLAGAGTLRSQRGSISLLALFVSLPAVLLVAFLVVTAQQTTRKQQMQGAADAGAHAAATTVARGLNAITAANKGMSDILAAMIAVRAMRDTARIMIVEVGAMIAAAAIWAPPLVVPLERELAFWTSFSTTMTRHDQELSNPATGSGWKAMQALDSANQAVKFSLPGLLQVEARSYAKANGADRFGVVLGGKGPPTRLPLGRGGEEYIAAYAGECALPKTRDLAAAAAVGYCLANGGFPCLTVAVAVPTYRIIEWQIARSLGADTPDVGMNSEVTAEEIGRMEPPGGGKSIDDWIAEENEKRRQKDSKAVPIDTRRVTRDIRVKSGFASMSWPADPPRPMMLAADAEFSPAWKIPDPRAPLNGNKVRRDLQFLMVARGSPPLVALGKDWLRPGQKGDGGLLTYGQAEVFNPNSWNMFDQHWRARLARASLVEDNLQHLGMSPNGHVRLMLRELNLH